MRAAYTKLEHGAEPWTALKVAEYGTTLYGDVTRNQGRSLTLTDQASSCTANTSYASYFVNARELAELIASLQKD